MSKVVIDSTKLTALGNKVRAKTSSSDLMTVDEMTDAVDTLGGYTDRDDIRTALAGKGVSASDHNFADFAADIGNIETVTDYEKLPDEYQRVEYIEGAGDRAIDTGVKMGGVNYIDIEMTPLGQNTASNWNSLFGIYTSSTHLQLYYRGTNATAEWNWASSSSSFSITLGSKYRFLIMNCVMLIYKDDVAYGTKGGIGTFAALEPPFVLLASSIPGGYAESTKGRIHKAILGKSPYEILFYGIPCYRLSDGVIGIYDTVNQAFNVGYGTGAFTKGADVN